MSSKRKTIKTCNKQCSVISLRVSTGKSCKIIMSWAPKKGHKPNNMR